MSEIDLISRQAFQEIAEHSDWFCSSDDFNDFLWALYALPSAQSERKRAKWIATTSLQEGQITWRDYKCSNCSHHRGKPMNFCEVCGAKMER